MTFGAASNDFFSRVMDYAFMDASLSVGIIQAVIALLALVVAVSK